MSVPMLYIPNLLAAADFSYRLNSGVIRLERAAQTADNRNRNRMLAKLTVFKQLVALWEDVRTGIVDERNVIELYKGYTKFRWEMRNHARSVKRCHEVEGFDRDVADGERAGLILMEDFFRAVGIKL